MRSRCLRITTGRNEERYKAGLSPDKIPVRIVVINNAALKCGVIDPCIVNCFAERLLRAGRKTATRITAKIRAINAMRIDSLKNCRIRSVLRAPTTFLIPISFARFADRAVDRFIKLIHANNKMPNATIANT